MYQLGKVMSELGQMAQELRDLGCEVNFGPKQAGPMRGIKVSNEYALAIPDYDKMPKAVLAALAMSLALRLSADDFQEARRLLHEEWVALYDAGIVPQKPV